MKNNIKKILSSPYILFIFFIVVWFVMDRAFDYYSTKNQNSSARNTILLPDSLSSLSNLDLQIIEDSLEVRNLKNSILQKRQTESKRLVDSILLNGGLWDKFFLNDSASVLRLHNWLVSDTTNLKTWVKNCAKVKFKLPYFKYSAQTQSYIWKKFLSEKENDLVVLDYLEKNFSDASGYFVTKMQDKAIDFNYLSALFLQLSKKTNVNAYKYVPIDKINAQISDGAFKNLGLALINYSKSKIYNDSLRSISLKIIQSYPQQNFLLSKNKTQVDFVTSDIIANLVLHQNPQLVTKELYYFNTHNIFTLQTLLLLYKIDPVFVNKTLQNWSKGKDYHYHLPNFLKLINQKSLDSLLLINYLNNLCVKNYNEYPLLLDDIAILMNQYKLNLSNFLLNTNIPDTSALYNDLLFTANLYQKNSLFYIDELYRYNLIDKNVYAKQSFEIQQNLYASIGNSLVDALNKSGFYSGFFEESTIKPIHYNLLIDYLFKHSSINHKSVIYDVTAKKTKQKVNYMFEVVFNNKAYKMVLPNNSNAIQTKVVLDFINFILSDNQIQQNFVLIASIYNENFVFFGNPKEVSAFFSKHKLY